MYLVLTALLALNVSNEILHAFHTVNNSLNNATSMVEKKNEDVFNSFKKKLEDPKTKEKAAIWEPKAQKAKAIADALYTYIEDLKLELKKESGLKKGENGEEDYKEDNLDAATRLFVEPPPSGKGKGKELFEKLKKFKEDILAIDPNILAELGPLPLDLSAPKTNNANVKDDLPYLYFHMTPTIAAITILSKFQNDVKNSEAQLVDLCHKKIGEVELIYDEFAAFAGTSSQYLMPGEELVITAGIGAFSKAAKPSISIDGANVNVKDDGTAEYKTTVSNAGSNTKKVHISFTKPDGTIATVEKDVKYTVGVPSGLVVSTDKTRVFYQGLENPLSVTGGGGDEKVTVTVEGNGVSSKKAGPGQYIVSCLNLGSATVTASDGKNNQKIIIPIKRVPDPLATVGGKANGPLAANVLRVQKGVAAELRDFIFEGVSYKVIAFTLICTGKGFEQGLGVAEVSGAYFNPEALDLLKRCQSGSTVVIDEIKVIGPGGTRTLDQNISFTLQ
jgi:gliding motility-associated protein GldM